MNNEVPVVINLMDRTSVDGARLMRMTSLNELINCIDKECQLEVIQGALVTKYNLGRAR